MSFSGAGCWRPGSRLDLAKAGVADPTDVFGAVPVRGVQPQVQKRTAQAKAKRSSELRTLPH
jgi:hypothetical protein